MGGTRVLVVVEPRVLADALRALLANRGYDLVDGWNDGEVAIVSQQVGNEFEIPVVILEEDGATVAVHVGELSVSGKITGPGALLEIVDLLNPSRPDHLHSNEQEHRLQSLLNAVHD